MVMQSGFSWSLFAIICAILCVISVAAMKFKRVQSSRRQGTANGISIARHSVHYEIREISRIRDALGAVVADTLLQKLADQIAAELKSGQALLVGPTSISFSFSAEEDARAALMREPAAGTLTCKTSVYGIEFCCSAMVTMSSSGTDNSTEADPIVQAQTAEQGRDARLELLRALPDALANGRITQEYQPKRELRTGKINSAEALLRWRRSDGSLVHTGHLIELVEMTGAIREVTLWTIRQAVADGKRLRDDGHALTIFVNMSGGLLSDVAYCQSVLELVADEQSSIGIEITETAVINDPAIAIDNLRAFALAGIAVAIDDFGAGLSSLEYLQQLPACELKIDRNFIAKLSTSNRNPLIVKATIDLAHALEMKVTAEGVEDPLSLALLKVMGCDMAQGYLVSPPLPVADLTEYLAENDKFLSLEASIDDARQGIV